MNPNAPATENDVTYHNRRLAELKTARNPWEKVWRPLGDFIEPTRLRMNSANEGSMARDKIIDSTGTFALRTLQSGMHSGITSPARPWFRLTTFDPELKDFGPVKTYLSQVEQRMREVYQSSNLYNAFHTGYGDLGQFGQSCALLVEDDENVIRMQQLLHGRFWLARDETGRATTLYRTFRWTVQRIVARFGYAKVPLRVKQNFDQAKYDQIYDINHAVEPRMTRKIGSIAKHDKPFLSNYWLEGASTTDGLLEESGFDENPIIAPAWELAGDDNYALSPGQIALGDVKMLQIEQQRKLEGIDKMVRPPMTGPTSMRNNPASLLPGSITFVDDPTGKGYRPAMEVNIRLTELAADIRETQERINRAFYADLFLMLANMEGIQPRNTFEIAERKEEKLLALGPVLENIYNGQLEPVIDRTYAILNRRGELPPPEELRDQELKIEYISMLAQAQKAIQTGGMERLSAYIGQLAAVKPDVLDKFDADEAVDLYADALGTAPSIIVTDDKVKAMRAARQQEQQQAKQAEMMATVAPAMNQGAQAASVLADAANNPSGQSLLQQIGIG